MEIYFLEMNSIESIFRYIIVKLWFINIKFLKEFYLLVSEIKKM